MNSFKTPFDASLSQIIGNVVFYLFFSLPMTIAMRSYLLHAIGVMIVGKHTSVPGFVEAALPLSWLAQRAGKA